MEVAADGCILMSLYNKKPDAGRAFKVIKSDISWEVIRTVIAPEMPRETSDGEDDGNADFPIDI